MLLSVLIWLSASTGIRVEIADREAPALRIAIAGRPASDPGILVIFPEHVTARRHGEAEARHLYLYRSEGLHPLWRIRGRVLEYTAILGPGLTMTARATLENDGVRYHYQFSNRSRIDYDMMQAVTDPRMIVRLERTWVHHRDGFDLLASETPSRATMPSHAQSTSHSSRLSRPTSNGSSPRFSRDPGNLWTNPELTCQHADPSIELKAGTTRGYEVKTFLIKGTLEDVLRKVREERAKIPRS